VKREFRVDRASLRKPEKTPHGFLRVEGYASRCGVFEYLNEDGTTRRELRLPEEVFRDDALRGFETAILTDGHPDTPVTADNVHRVDVGHVIGAARRDGDHVATSILITDLDVIAKVEAGDTGLSVGYAVDLDETPGVHPQYGHYDAIQRNLVINHLAVAVEPRAGETARIRMDGMRVAERIPDEEPAGDRADDARIAPLGKSDKTDSTTEEMPPMADEKEIKTDDALAEAKAEIAQLLKEVADLKEKLGEKMAADEAEAVKAEKGRADAAESSLNEYRGLFTTAVRARAELEKVVESVMGPTYRMDGKDDPDLMRAVVHRLDSTIDPATPLPELRGHYKQLVARHTTSKQSYAAAAQVLAGGRNDRADKQADKIKHDWDNQHLQTLNKGATR
jgi:hypothetical protein